MSTRSAADFETEPGPALDVLDADRALILACLAWPDWPGQSSDSGVGDGADFELKIWNWIEAGWLRRLSLAWAYVSSQGSISPAAALNRLRGLHAQAARLDLARIHPSWLERGLREETAAIAQVAARTSPERVRLMLIQSLESRTSTPPPSRAADQEIIGWVRSLWTERLLGGRGETELDPPEIVALTQISNRETLRLCRLWGFFKLVLADRVAKRKRVCKLEQGRIEWVKVETVRDQAAYRPLVQYDMAMRVKVAPEPHRLARDLGALGLARLLKDHDPFRLRWAFQHLPYPLVKQLRAAIPRHLENERLVLKLERDLLKLAWRRLNLERRIQRPWPEGLATAVDGLPSAG